MQKISIVFIWIVIAYGFMQQTAISRPNSVRSTHDNQQLLQEAFANKRNNIQVKGEGTVIKLLPDDLDGGKHQRFLVRLASGQTLLISHNIDLAPRINSLQAGDFISFSGEYEWNPQGGLIHWTHQDPSNRHIGGWIEHDGKLYQ
jgi:hypothetical protein